MQGESWHSQEGEDKYVYENFFYGMRGGFFFEMGALDGVLFSNTLWMARAADWRGLLIEPGPGRRVSPGSLGQARPPEWGHHPGQHLLLHAGTVRANVN